MRRLKLLAVLLLFPAFSYAGTISGQIQTSTGGVQANGTLTFTLSQPAVLSGTATIVTSTTACYTSNAGNVVGVPDPQSPPSLSANYGAGTLAAGTYYVVITYAGAGGESVASPETVFTMTGSGTLLVNPPGVQPSTATGFKVYIGTSSGGEKLQGTVTGWTQFSQSVALVSVTSLPVSNTSACSLYFSDQLIPTGTFYSVNFLNNHGSQISGFPQTWCTFGGQSGTINISNGAPTGNCGTQGVFYPTPILAVPQNNAQQSIAGTLATTGFTTASLNNRILVDGTKYPFTAAGIQAAIDDAYVSGSREVWLPCGNVNINATLTITHGGFKLKGCGAGFTDAGTLPATVLTYTGAAGGDLLQVTGLQSARIDRVILENLILDCNALCRYASRWEKVDEHELHGVRQRGNGATGAAMYQVDATGGKLINSWFSQCSTYCLVSDWGTGGLWWAGGGIDTLVANTNPLVLVQGAVNAWHITGVEMDASGGAAFVGFIQITGFDTNSSFASAPTGGAGAPIQVTISDSSFFMKAGSGAPSQGADILITGTATNPSQAAVLERLYFGGLSISAAAVKYDRTQRAVFQNSYTTGHVTSSLITTANTNTPAMAFVVSGDPLRCTGANCGILLDLTVDTVAGRLASLSGFTCASAAGCQLGSAAIPAADAFLGNAANQAVHFDVSALTAVRLAKFPDNAGTVAEHNLDNGFTATQTLPALALKNSNSLTITPNSIASARAVSVNDPLNSAVLPLYITAADNTVDLASVASGACTSERTVAVTGARFGDDVRVMAGTALEAGTFLVGKVTSADNTKWQFCNLSGGAVDRASDSYTIRVTK